jgi:hypothetical protein
MEKHLSHLLNVKKPDLEPIKKMCLDHSHFRDELVDYLAEKNETLRYNSFLVLNSLAEEKPGLLYPYWDTFVKYLKSEKVLQVLVGIELISRLVSADTKNLFEKVADDYFNLINHPNVIPIRYLMLNCWRIGKARPEYIPRIRDLVFSIDVINQEHKGLLKGDGIIAFAQLWNLMENKEEIIAFVKDQLDSESPKTIKEAKKFLKEKGNL